MYLSSLLPSQESRLGAAFNPLDRAGRRTVSATWAASGPGPLAVAVAYYLGCQLGFVSVSRPGTSILLASERNPDGGIAAVASPRCGWFLLAALPAHAQSSWSSASPFPLIFGLYVSNCVEP